MSTPSVVLRALLPLVLAVAALGVVPGAGAAQRTEQPADGRVDPRSPRAAITEFLTHTRRGEYEAAARFLGPGVGANGATLARRLKAVLDRHLWIEVDRVSPFVAGDTADGLPRNREELGTVPNDVGVREPVLLQQQAPGVTPAWVFAPPTVARIEGWYDALDDLWLRDVMPLALQNPGPFGIELWQWLALLLFIPLALGIGWILGRLTGAILRRVARQTETMLDDRVLARTAGPMTALWGVVAYRALVEAVGLSIGVEQAVGMLVRALAAAITTWLFVRVTLVLEEEVPATPWAVAKPELRALVPLVGRVTRIFVLALGGILIVAQFGYKIATLLAGLGIGGIALALAAQKTLEHMFGSVAIGLDQPIRVGDFIEVGGTRGEVETIGLRSTRIRTLERSLVVIPNGSLSDMKMENFGFRDRFLLRTSIGLEYGTTAAQLKEVRDGLERVLREHSMVWPDRVVVRFESFGAYSLNIEVIAWVVTTEVDRFREAREQIYHRFMQVVEEAGCAFAFPTQTIHVERQG